MPSPRPVNPMPSVVVALTPTASADTPSALGEPRPHRLAIGRQLGRFADHDDIGVADAPARGRQPGDNLAQQANAVGAGVGGVGVGKQGADVGQPAGAQQRVNKRVCDNVGIRVPGETQLVRHRHPGQDQRPAGDEAVRVVADADPRRQLRSPS